MKSFRYGILLIGLTGIAAACDVESQTGVRGSSSPVVQVADFVGFTPESTAVAKGTTITWGWFANNTYQHNVHFDTDTTLASQLQTFGTFMVQFPNAGTFRYHCTVHSNEHGVVTVQ